jgi:serralysin
VTDGDLGVDGDKVFTAQVTDVAGNVGTAGGSLTVTLDTTAPTPNGPVIDVLTASDTGTNTTDNISSDSSPQVRITFASTGAVANEVVTLYAGSTVIATATLSATDITNGITVTPDSALGADGTYVLKAVVTDVAGNDGVDSTTISYQLDSANNAPTASLVSVSNSGFVISATDTDVQPDWNALSLESNVALTSDQGGVVVLSDGNNTTFTVAQQGSVLSTSLAVSDGVASDVSLLSGSTSVALTVGSAFGNQIGGTEGFNNLLYGFGGNDEFIGSGSQDYIYGGSGSDTIDGGAGDDFLYGESGSDIFVFNSATGVDTIADYTVEDDSMQLSKAIFTGLGDIGALSSDEFVSGAGLTAAADGTDRIVYDTTSGNLYYDADGSGGDAAVQIATFTGTPDLLSSEFAIIA